MTQEVGKLIPRAKREEVVYVPPSSLQYDKYANMARENPNQAVLVARDFPEPQSKTLRARKRAPYRTPEGRIIVRLVRTKKGDDGVRRGDLTFEWEASQ